MQIWNSLNFKNLTDVICVLACFMCLCVYLQGKCMPFEKKQFVAVIERPGINL